MTFEEACAQAKGVLSPGRPPVTRRGLPLAFELSVERFNSSTYLAEAVEVTSGLSIRFYVHATIEEEARKNARLALMNARIIIEVDYALKGERLAIPIEASDAATEQEQFQRSGSRGQGSS